MDILNISVPDALKGQSEIIKVIGVGGGGNNAVNHMFNAGIKGVDFVNCNTDKQVLDASHVPNIIHLGSRTLGAGANPDVGRKAAEESIDEIRALLEINTQMLFITAGMGGGTGTGAAPVIASVAREMGILTVAIVTEPFTFEGTRRCNQARQGIQELKKHVDVLLVISNDKLREQYGDLKMTAAFHKADNILLNAAKGIAEIITKRGYVNVDFEDAKTVLSNSGSAIIGTGFAEGEDRAITAVEEAISSPLLNNNDINGAKNVLIYISYGDEEVSMDEVGEITDIVSVRAGKSADVIWGQGFDESLGNKIAVTVIATGFNDTYHASHEPKVPSSQYTVPQKAQPKVHHLLNPESTSTPIEERASEIHAVVQESNQSQAANENHNSTCPSSSDRIVHTMYTDDHPVDENIADSESTIEQEEDDYYQMTLKNKPEAIALPKETPSIQKTEEAYIDTLDGKKDEIYKKKIINTSQTSDISTQQAREQESMEEKLGDDRNNSMLLYRHNATDMNIEQLENQPAYIRKKRIAYDDAPISSNSSVSNYCMFEGENGLELRKNNSFLHDNVD